MAEASYFRLQFVVFALVSAALTNTYITQPVLPVLQREFGADLVVVSFSVSAVILGIAISNLPFGLLADRLPIQPIILVGGVMVGVAGLICAITTDLRVLIGARFLQGIFIPASTTCLAAYLAKTLPAARLNVVMGSYVAATVLGGLGGRLLGGWIHPPLHWRYAFVTAAVLIVVATIAALRVLPRATADGERHHAAVGYWALLRQWRFLRIYLFAAGGFAVFSSIFNYLPFRLAAPPFRLSTELTTLLYLAYVVGILMGPTAGRLSNRVGSGATLLGGIAVVGASLLLVYQPSVAAVVIGLVVLCAGFFTLHAAAFGSLNGKLSSGQGRANALYVLFYYLGGWAGITASGLVYKLAGWGAVLSFCAVVLVMLFVAGIGELKDNRKAGAGGIEA